MPKLTIQVVGIKGDSESLKDLMPPREYYVAAGLSAEEIKAVESFLQGLFKQDALVVHKVGTKFELELSYVNHNYKAYEIDETTKERKQFANFDEVMLYLLVQGFKAEDDSPIRNAVNALPPATRKKLTGKFATSVHAPRLNEKRYEEIVSSLHPVKHSWQFGIQILNQEKPYKIKFMESPDHITEGSFDNYADVLRYVFTYPGNIARHLSGLMLQSAVQSPESFQSTIAFINGLYPDGTGKPQYVEELIGKLTTQAGERATSLAAPTSKLRESSPLETGLSKTIQFNKRKSTVSLKFVSHESVSINNGEISFFDRPRLRFAVTEDKERSTGGRTVKYLIPYGKDKVIEREIVRKEFVEGGKQMAHWVELNILPQGDLPNGLSKIYPDKIDEKHQPYYFKVDERGNQLKLIAAKMDDESLYLTFQDVKTGAKSKSSVLITPNRHRIPPDLMDMTKPKQTNTTTPPRKSRS